MIVYLLTCKVNGLKYVGQSETSLDERWAQHVASSRCPRSRAYRKMAVVRAIAEHSPESFDREVLTECETYKHMDETEIRLIAELGTMDPAIGYNRSAGGDAPMRGKKHTTESKALMSAAKRNMSEKTRVAIKVGQARVNADPEVRRRKSEAAKKRVKEKGFSEEHRAKIAEANSGENNAFFGKRFGRSANPTPLTEETKRRLSEAHKGKILSEVHRAAIARGVAGKSSSRGLNRRPVHVYENEQHIMSYLKLEFVAEDMNVSLKTTRSWLRSGKKFGNRRYVQDESTISALRSK